MRQKTRIMYIEYKGNDVVGAARIGRVSYSKSGKTIYYRGRTYSPLRGYGFKSNFLDQETREEYWISGCKKDGSDALYSTIVEIDDDVREGIGSRFGNVLILSKGNPSRELVSIRNGESD